MKKISENNIWSIILYVLLLMVCGLFFSIEKLRETIIFIFVTKTIHLLFDVFVCYKVYKTDEKFICKRLLGTVRKIPLDEVKQIESLFFNYKIITVLGDSYIIYREKPYAYIKYILSSK